MDISGLLLNQSFPSELIELLIFIPIIATVLSIGRYILGLKTLGIYAPIILAISYKLTGIEEGLAITAVVILGSILAHKMLSKFRMHYITRVASSYTILCTMIIIGILVLNLLPISIPYTKDINPLGLVLIATLSDSFIKMYVKKDLVTSIRAILETLIVSITGWYIITSESILNWLINNIWVIPTLIVFNLLLGQYSGFRLKEIIRFKGIPKDDRKNFGNK